MVRFNEVDGTTDLAMRVVNLRKALEIANGCIKAHADKRGLVGYLTVACDEEARPSFRGGRKFWAAVRALKREVGADADG